MISELLALYDSPCDVMKANALPRYANSHSGSSNRGPANKQVMELSLFRCFQFFGFVFTISVLELVKSAKNRSIGVVLKDIATGGRI